MKNPVDSANGNFSFFRNIFDPYLFICFDNKLILKRIIQIVNLLDYKTKEKFYFIVFVHGKFRIKMFQNIFKGIISFIGENLRMVLYPADGDF